MTVRTTYRLVSADWESADVLTATFQPERAVNLPDLAGVTCEWMVLWRGGSGTTFAGDYVVAPVVDGEPDMSLSGRIPITDLVAPA